MKKFLKVFFSLTLVLAMALSLSACKDKKPSAEEVAKNFISAVTMADIDQAVNYVSDSSSFDFYYENNVTNLHSLLEYLVAMYDVASVMPEDIYTDYISTIEEVCRETLEKHTVEVTEVSQEEASATVTAVISTPDINSLLDLAIDFVIDIEDYSALELDDWIEVLSQMEMELKSSAAGIELTAYEESFSLVKVDGDWKVVY